MLVKFIKAAFEMACLVDWCWPN